MSKATGGCAFPYVKYDWDAGNAEVVGYGEGMTLRDYFAAAAMQGFLTHSGAMTDIEGVAKHAYMVADEMLKVREEE